MTPMASVPRADGASPAMAQWFAAKADHPDALLFFRMGDFYELFFADAEAAAAALDIALTQRGEHAGAPIPMCGVPYHAAEAYLARLIRRGFRVAVAEQMEDPKARTGKAPIRREVVRLITPGTHHRGRAAGRRPPQPAARPGAEAGRRHDGIGAAWLDVSTGLFETAALTGAGTPRPARPAGAGRDPRPRHARRSATGPTGARPDTVPSPPLVARRRLAEAFGAASLDAFGSFTDARGGRRRRWRWTTCAPPRRAPCRASPAPRRRAAPGCWRWTPRPAPAWRSCAPATAATQHTLFAAVQRTLTAGGRAPAGGLAGRAADRPRRDRRAAGRLVLAARQPARGRHAARRPARRAGHRPRARPAVA